MTGPHAELVLTDAKSDKFWNLTSDGCDVTVHYGRRGTDGQSRTKTYDSPAEADEQATKQIADKRKKGYVDAVGTSPAPAEAGSATAAAPPATPQPPEPKSSLAKAAAPEPTDPAPESAEAAEQFSAGVDDSDDIGLVVSPFDALLDLNAAVPVFETDDVPFDPAEARSRAERIARRVPSRKDYSYVSYEWQTTEPVFSRLPSQEAAWWWWWLGGTDESTVQKSMAAAEARDEDEYRRYFPSGDPNWTSGTSAAIRLSWAIAHDTAVEPQFHDKGGFNLAQAVIETRAMQRLDPETVDRMRDAIPRPLPPPYGPSSYGAGLVDRTVFVAAAVGRLEAEVAACLDEIPDGHLAARFGYYPRDNQGVLMSLLADSPAARVALCRRIAAQPDLAFDITAWVIGTGAAGLDQLQAWIDNASSQTEASVWLSRVAMILHGPGAVAFFCRQSTGRAAAVATAWLATHIDAVLAAKVPPSVTRAVTTALRAVPTERLERAREHAGSTVAAAIDICLAEAELSPADRPDWLPPAAKTKLRAWLDPAAMPPLVLAREGAGGVQRLAVEQVRDLLAAATDPGSDVLDRARDELTERSRDEFAIALFNAWLAGGAVAKETWAMVSAGRLGSDGYALMLAPRVREWPGQSQHKRAVSGLEALQAVGTDTALQQISGIAAKVKFQALKARAAEAMDAIAEQRGLSRDELEDRIVPDGGLDERGQARFDYGARQFLVGITPETKLAVRELGADGQPTGKPKTALPTPRQDDDADLAKTAKADLAALRKSLTALAKVQVTRFELAMTGARRWTPADHATFIASHPLLRSLLRGIVWGVYTGDGSLAGLVRLDPDDGTLLDAEDNPVEVAAGSLLGIVHPIELSAEDKQRWGEVLADFELIACFRQLDRANHTLPADQGDDVNLHGLPSQKVVATTLVSTLTRHGWSRGAALDNGIHTNHSRAFAGAGLTAVIAYEGMWTGSPTEQEDQKIEAVFARRGLHAPGEFGWAEIDSYDESDLIPWRDVPAVVASEVLSMVDDLNQG